jgi:hypothetical protein
MDDRREQMIDGLIARFRVILQQGAQMGWRIARAPICVMQPPPVRGCQGFQPGKDCPLSDAGVIVGVASCRKMQTAL